MTILFFNFTSFLHGHFMHFTTLNYIPYLDTTTLRLFFFVIFFGNLFWTRSIFEYCQVFLPSHHGLQASGSSRSRFLLSGWVTICFGTMLQVLSYSGVLFICFNVDQRVLWSGTTEDVVKDGFQFYTTFFNAPPAIKVPRLDMTLRSSPLHNFRLSFMACS